MDLTREQVGAAKACGCAFFPATEAQVARLSMQRRVFRIDGKAFMATRDGGGFKRVPGEGGVGTVAELRFPVAAPGSPTR